jgi:hypothetical protein
MLGFISISYRQTVISYTHLSDRHANTLFLHLYHNSKKPRMSSNVRRDAMNVLECSERLARGIGHMHWFGNEMNVYATNYFHFICCRYSY